jgi:hypothetical protein
MSIGIKKITSSLAIDPNTEVVVDSEGIIRYPANGLTFEYQKLSKLLLSTISLSLEEKSYILRSLHKLQDTQREKLESVLENEFENLKKVDMVNTGYLKDIRHENTVGLNSMQGITVRVRDFEK